MRAPSAPESRPDVPSPAPDRAHARFRQLFIACGTATRGARQAARLRARRRVLRPVGARPGRPVSLRERRLAGPHRDSARQAGLRRLLRSLRPHRRISSRCWSRRRRPRRTRPAPTVRRSATSSRRSWMKRASSSWRCRRSTPELAVIDALANKTDLARYFGRQVKLGVAGTPLTGFVDGDAQEPSRNIIYLGQGGIGLPDRDYYLKPDPKLREYRAKYEAYIAAGAHRRQGAEPGRGRSRHRRLRDPSGPRALDQRREPRRGEDLQQGGHRRPAGAVPRPGLGGVDRRAGHRRRTGRGDRPAELREGAGRRRRRHADGTVEAVPEVPPRRSLRALPPRARS